MVAHLNYTDIAIYLGWQSLSALLPPRTLRWFFLAFKQSGLLQLSSCHYDFLVGCSQFSVPLPAWFLLPGGPTASRHCSGTSIGCLSLSMSMSSVEYVCWPSGVYMAWHCRTSLMMSTRLLLVATVVTSGPLTLQLWWLGPPDAWQQYVSCGSCSFLVQSPTSHQMHHHFCLSGAAWRHGFLTWLWCKTDVTWLHFVSFCFYPHYLPALWKWPCIHYDIVTLISTLLIIHLLLIVPRYCLSSLFSLERMQVYTTLTLSALWQKFSTQRFLGLILTIT